MVEKLQAALMQNKQALLRTLAMVRAYRLRSEVELSGVRASRDADFRGDCTWAVGECRDVEKFLQSAIATIDSDLASITRLQNDEQFVGACTVLVSALDESGGLRDK